MLQLLRRIVQALDRAADLNSALDSVVCDVKKAMKVDGCSLFLADSDRGEYLLIAADGLPAGLTGRMRIKYGQGLIGSVGEREELINLEDAKLHPNFNESKLVATTGYRSFMGVPIIDQGDLLGVLCVQKKRKGAFDNDQEAFLVTLAVQLGGKIAQAVAKGALQAGKNRRKLQKDTILRGISGASGIAIGEAVVVFPPADLDSVPDRSISAKQIPIELENFKQALTAVRDDIIVLRKQANNQLSATEEVLFNAYLQILDSPTLFEEIVFEIKNKIWAPTALKRVVHRHLSQFDVMEDVYLQERASDFRDLGRRILSHLQSKQPVKPHYAKKTILVSEEVTATMMMEVPLGQLVGIVSGLGSSNSHVAILGRALGIPTVMGAENMPILQLDSQELIVDGYNGEVYVAPSRAVKREFMLLAKEEAQLDRELEALRELPAETPDHHRVNLYINTGLSGNLGLSLSVGAEGVGLYRTELPFMLSDRLPSEDEQCKMYTELLKSFSPDPVIMRTLDIGGDKSLPYFPIEEDNPFLGWRGIRVTLDHPQIFLQQLRAMLRANEHTHNLSILLPMISSVGELEASLRFINQAVEELREEGHTIEKPPVGLMVEVPAAVYQAYELAKRANFISVGSNDLIQYLLAVDRNNPRVADLYDGLHPAVLRALKQVVDGGHRAKVRVSICGELAGDPLAAILLLAMGYDSLSMNARVLPRIKWVLRQFTLEKAKTLLEEVLGMDEPREIRCHMEMALEEQGLGGLIRAGK